MKSPEQHGEEFGNSYRAKLADRAAELYERSHLEGLKVHVPGDAVHYYDRANTEVVIHCVELALERELKRCRHWSFSLDPEIHLAHYHGALKAERARLAQLEGKSETHVEIEDGIRGMLEVA